MYEILETLKEKRVTSTREMTLILARCCHCKVERTMLLQNAIRANKGAREFCPSCIEDTFHRMTDTRFYSIWKGMLERATNPKNKDWARYGAVGRGVDPAWMVFKNFYNDMFTGYSDDLTLDRKDNSKGYSKANCRWVSNMCQQANKNNNRVIRYLDRDMHLAEFCRVAKVGRGAISPRLDAGMSAEEALQDYANSRYKKNRKPRFPKSTTL